MLCGLKYLTKSKSEINRKYVKTITIGKNVKRIRCNGSKRNGINFESRKLRNNDGF